MKLSFWLGVVSGAKTDFFIKIYEAFLTKYMFFAITTPFIGSCVTRHIKLEVVRSIFHYLQKAMDILSSVS